MTPEFDELKRYVGFGDDDVHHLLSIGPIARPVLPFVIERFYDVLFEHPEARSVFSDGQAQVERLRASFSNWLETLFDGQYDENYFNARIAIGRRHVQVGLPQKYMPLAMEVVWRELRSQILNRSTPDVEPSLTSLHKLLMLDLTLMLGSFKERYSEEIRSLERRNMEGKLARARHLAEIGQLAASLAHEIKNPLAGISGAIQIIGASLPAESPYKSIVGDILAQITRVDATVKDLLLYARPSSAVFHEVDVSQLLHRITSVLREEPALRNIDISFEPCEIRITADERLLEQLLINLILNAAHASPEHSIITVHAKRDVDRFHLTVADKGCGMTPDILEQATDPFFTTKAKGTGLGLAICNRIAESHDGTISITSNVGEGTCVTVSFPYRTTPSDQEID
jgi:signal transduction histidine kinase